MAQLSMKCPHCRTEKIGFTQRTFVQLRPGTNKTLLFLQCEGCGHAVTAVVGANVNSVYQWANNQADSPGPLQEIYPAPVAVACPADVPSSVRSAFLSGVDNLGRQGGANAAAMMFRRAIEVAVKSINPTAPRSANLQKRISELPDSVATPAMKDWANHIRLDANDAAHEVEEYSDDDAKKLHTFAEMFLTYAFTLPAMLKRARGEG